MSPEINGTSLYPPTKRRTATVLVVLLSVFFLFMVRHAQNGSLKILMLYSVIACVMCAIVVYKKSINRYETGIFFFLCIQLLSIVPRFDKLDSLVASSYLLSYRYGVSSRGFAATVVDFLTNGPFISKTFVWHFIFCITVFLSFVISVYIGIVIKKAKNEAKTFLLFLSLLYISCFTSPSVYYGPANFGRTEIFAFLFMLCLIAVIDKPRIRWIIPVLALCTLAVHIILIFFYIPFIVIMLFYTVLSNKEKQNLSVFLLILTVTVIVAGFFCYVSFYKSTFVFHTAHDFSDYLTTKTNLNFSERWLHAALFANLKDHLNDWKNNVQLKYSGNVSILINIPLVFMFILFWIKCFLQERKKINKFFFLLPVMILFYHASVFFMFYDFGRWMTMILNIQFMLVFYLVYNENKTTISVVKAITPFIKRKRFIVIWLCLIMTFLGPVDQRGPSDKVSHFVKGISMIFSGKGVN